MYKTSNECYQGTIIKPINYNVYKGPISSLVNQVVNQVDNQVDNQVVNPVVNPVFDVEKSKENETPVKQLHMKWKTSKYTRLSDPNIWGPAFWFILHNGSSKYPISATPFAIDRMKGFIKGIPIMLPCPACKYHAICHIQDNLHNLDDICSGRDKLFAFFVDFHNIVNKRYGKPSVSVEEAYKSYNEGIEVSTLTYE
jgi:hypothetical protein